MTVDPASAPQGAEITLGFRVPNEEPNAGTVKIQIFFPSDHPILGVDPQSVPGWHDTIHTANLNPPVQTDDGLLTDYVSEVDWAGGPSSPATSRSSSSWPRACPRAPTRWCSRPSRPIPTGRSSGGSTR